MTPWSTCRSGPGRPLAGWGLELGEALRDGIGVGRVVVVGRAPNRCGDARLPVTGACGRALARLAGVRFGLRWLLDVDRANLLERWPARRGRGDGWIPDDARARARLLGPLIAPRRAVLLGREVCEAFAVGGLEPLAWAWSEVDGCLLLVGHLPHPSGLNRWWDDGEHRAAGAAWLRAALWGEALKIEALAGRRAGP